MSTSMNIKKTLKDNTIFIALVVVMLFFQILITATGNGSLFSPGNIKNLINQNAYVVVLATGMLCCILTGGNIDLSIGSIVCLVGAIAGTLIKNMGCNIYLSILICLVVGILIGAWHGMWIAYIHIPPFIVTLAGMLLWRGVALIILN
ncbi:MAG: sugar ABC transporter permease, partial [Treponema sp.]|nr:sugar ABC transporter permease [Treponema sp.]